MGEHGDSSFIPWSLANISNLHVSDCSKAMTHAEEKIPPLNYAEIEEYVRKSGGRIIERKGATLLRRVDFGLPHLPPPAQRH